LVTSYNLLLASWAVIREHNLSICDGLGVIRVIQCVSQLINNTGTAINLRPAKPADTKQVYDWQTLPQTRQYALVKNTPTWLEHNQWMKTKLTSFTDFFYIIESHPNNQRIGVVRLDKQTANEYLVSIFIDPQCYGRGYAKASLKYLDLLHPSITIKATVLVENSASQHLFSAANYQRISPDTFIRTPL